MKKQTDIAEQNGNAGRPYTWKSGVRDFLIFLVIFTVLFQVILGISRVRGTSMEDTLSDGQVVFFLRLVPEYRRGDVVAARTPSGALYVKRIVAVGGDVLELRDGTLYINGVPEPASPAHGQTLPLKDGIQYPYELAPGTYFLMGDNREHSLDSRIFGSLPRSNLKGRLFGH